jgi:hypothetical protein
MNRSLLVGEWQQKMFWQSQTHSLIVLPITAQKFLMYWPLVGKLFTFLKGKKV